MIKLNKKHKTVLKEEIGRACLIMHAQNRLDEHDFQTFMNELRDYEANITITESNQNDFLYEGFFERLKNLASGTFAKIAPDNQQKIQDLSDQLDRIMRGDLAMAKETGNKADEAAAMGKARMIVKDIAKLDPKMADDLKKAFEIEMEEVAPDGGGDGGGGNSQAQDDAKKVAQAGDQKAQSARGDSFFSKLFGKMGDSALAAQDSNTALYNMATRGFNSFFQPKQPIPINQEDNVLMTAFMNLYNKNPELARMFAQMNLTPDDMQAHMDKTPDGAADDDEGGAEGEGAEEEGGLSKDTPVSIMTRQKDVKPGKGGEKEAPLVMSIEKMGISQKSAQQIAKRIGQYLKQRKIAIAENMNRLTVADTDKIVENIVFNAPKSLLLTLFEEVSEEDMEEIFAARRTKDPKKMKKVYRKMAMKYHPDRGGSADDMAKVNKEIGKKVQNSYKEDEKEDEKPVKASGETPSAKDIEKDIKSKPEKAAIIFVKDLKKAGVKVDDETSTALATQFDKIKRDMVPREKISTALALVVSNAESGETSPRDAKIQVAGIANLDPDKDITKQTPPEKVIRNAFKAERARIRAMSKGKGVIHKIISRFISDNQFLMKKDPALKDIFDDQPKFNQFAKKIRKNIRRMLQRRGYEESEIGNLLERMNVEAEMRNSVKKVLMEHNK